METSKLKDVLADVLLRLPVSDQVALNRFWSKAPAIHPTTLEEMRAPLVLVVQNWTSMGNRHGEGGLASVLNDGRVLVFDEGFVSEAPVEAVESLLAHELAHIFARTQGAKQPEKMRTRERIVARRIAKWGFSEDDIDLWEAAQEIQPADRAAAYYAARVLRMNRMPPATADLEKIALRLINSNRQDLAQKVLALGSIRGSE